MPGEVPPMRSPFPGMDPFLEGHAWRGFHADFITELKQSLNGNLSDRFVARTETDVTINEYGDWDSPQGRIGDVTVSDRGEGGTAVAVAEPATATFLTEYRVPDERRHRWIEIFDNDSMKVVTVIELLSPENKRGLNTRHTEKRLEVLASDASFVELDLLRGGRKPRTVDRLPPCDYAAFVSEAWTRPKVTVYPWRLLDPLPDIPIPLLEGIAPVPAKLQEVFGRTFEEGRYAHVVRYDRPCDPPLPESAGKVLREWQAARR